MSAPENVHDQPARWALPLVFVLAVGLKVLLLFTSQSMADGDEAVAGLMGMHVLEGKGHALYPWGVRYGAGAGLETHVAAAFFALAGISSIVLKSVGLLWWSLGLALVAGIGRAMGGPRLAVAAVLLHGMSPAAAQWSLKVSGGHQVAVLLCLVMILLHERKVAAARIVPLAPLAAYAHPIALPFAAIVSVVWSARARRPLVAFGALLLAAAAAWLALHPRLAAEQEAWNPVARGFAPLVLARRLAATLLTLFSPNLNAMSPPRGFLFLVSFVWLLVCGASLVLLRRTSLAFYALAVLGVVFLVDPRQLTARHLLVLLPIASLAIGRACLTAGRLGLAASSLLVVLGGSVQLIETRSPQIFGAGRESDGVDRAEVNALLEELEQRGVRHVYTTEPMLSWILMFESREGITARWLDPNDRVPAYAEEVDAARRAGRPVALVERAGRDYQVRIDPDPATIDARFRPATPAVAAAPSAPSR